MASVGPAAHDGVMVFIVIGAALALVAGLVFAISYESHALLPQRRAPR